MRAMGRLLNRIAGKAPQQREALANHPMGGILRPQAVGRWLMPSIAAITPQYVEMVLKGAMAGAHQQQAELFDLMLDTWPELASCAQELALGVSERKVSFQPWCEENEDPSPEAVERKNLVSAALRSMRPDPATPDENDLPGTIAELANGWFAGMVLLEIGWESARNPGQWHQINGGAFDGMTAPRCTAWVHHRGYAFDERGRIGLALTQDTSSFGARQMIDPLPANKFLIGTHKAKTGTITGSALLRPLAWWWCAANFASDWVLNLAQLFGIPFRWATHDRNASEETIAKICTMLQNMGSAGYGSFPEGTNIEFLEAGKNGSDHSPQGELLDRADRYARLLILGQTMSGSQDSSKGGGKAFGSVEAGVKEARVAACAKYVEAVLNRQLIPAILEVNYGDDSFAPTLSLETEHEEDLLQKAQIVQILANAGAGKVIGLDWLGAAFNIPKPEKGEETLQNEEPPSTKSTKSMPSTKEDEEDQEDLNARLARIMEIQDDALFARELALMGEALCAGDVSGESRNEMGRWVADPSEGTITPDAARALLKKGIDTKDVFGNPVRFDSNILEHWEAEGHSVKEQDRRLRRLLDAVKAVENPQEVWQGDKQTNHLGAFEDKESKLRYSVGTILENGKARSFRHDDRAKEINKYRKGTQIHVRK